MHVVRCNLGNRSAAWHVTRMAIGTIGIERPTQSGCTVASAGRTDLTCDFFFAMIKSVKSRDSFSRSKEPLAGFDKEKSGGISSPRSKPPNGLPQDGTSRHNRRSSNKPSG